MKTQNDYDEETAERIFRLSTTGLIQSDLPKESNRPAKSDESLADEIYSLSDEGRQTKPKMATTEDGAATEDEKLASELFGLSKGA